jgi:GntR family transcriptional regulator
MTPQHRPRTAQLPPAPEPLPRLARTLPAYLQIEEELAARIEGGELHPGDRLPTERQLADQLGVSRMTVRQALARLEARGLVRRRQGSGTYAATPKLRQDASHLRGFFEQTIVQGVVPQTRLLEKSEILATRTLAAILDLRLGEPVYKVVRLRSAHGAPVVLETSFFPARRVPGLLELDVEHASIYRLMEEHYAARPVRAVQSLEPMVAQSAEAHLLQVPVGSALMLVERTAWDAAGRPVEHARDLYRGDRSRFVSELSL